MFDNAGYKVSLIRDDFPLPETPVIQINFPKGNFTFIFFRLLAFAFDNVKNFCLFSFLLLLGTGIFNFPERYLPVILFSLFLILLGYPSATTFPPFSPAPGPISTT